MSECLMNKLLIFIFILATIFVASCGKPSKNNTGVISSLIIDGKNVEDSDPIRQSVVRVGTCSGVLISEDLVLTAAHCVTTASIRLFFGVNITTNSKAYVNLGRSLPTIASNVFKVHSGYKGKVGENDIAIIKLPEKVMTDYLRPVTILSPDYLLESNTPLLIAGYGAQCISCADPYAEHGRKSTSLQKRNQLFVKYDKLSLRLKQSYAKEGAFSGDSGGPAYLETQTELLLTGITSGQFQTEPEVVYTNVSAYKNLILEFALQTKASLPIFKMPNE